MHVMCKLALYLKSEVLSTLYLVTGVIVNIVNVLGYATALFIDNVFAVIGNVSGSISSPWH